jgi:hypoxanthine phosphoribosyltransferase
MQQTVLNIAMATSSPSVQLTPLYTAADLSAAVLAMAKAIDTDWQQVLAQNPRAQLAVVVVLNGAIHVGSALSLALTTPHVLGLVKAVSYEGMQRVAAGATGVQWVTPVEGLAGCHVLLVEDIVDTGHTLQALQKALQPTPDTPPLHYWKTATLLDKPNARQVPITPDYCGFTLTGMPFVVGYGLDVDNYYRDLPFIAVYQPPTLQES